MPYYFPSCEEIVVLSERPIRKNLTVAPAIELPVIGSKITVGSYSVDEEGIHQETLKLTVHDEHDTDVYWLVALCISRITHIFSRTFRKLMNDNSPYSPSSIQFLIVVTTARGPGTCRESKFPFQLQILSGVEVIPSKGPDWGSVRLIFGAKKSIQPIDIKEGLDSKRAEECFKDLKNGRPAVGLKKAMIPYQTALRINSPAASDNLN
jgi:hypothetical protein